MKSLIKFFFYKIGYQISKINKQASKMDVYLHKYKNYEEYKKVQIKFNKLKIDNVWADEAVLSFIVNFLKKIENTNLNYLAYVTDLEMAMNKIIWLKK